MGLSNQLQMAITERGTVAFDAMVREAARWKGAAMQVAKLVWEVTDSKREGRKLALKISRMTTKGDLDDYLMRKFDLDSSDARAVSNYLTHHNTPPDMKARLGDFAKEPWAKLVLSYEAK